MAAFFGSGDARITVIAVVLAVLVCGAGGVHAQRTDEFNVTMDAAIANSQPSPFFGIVSTVTAANLKTYLDANDDTTPLVLDVRPRYEYNDSHIPGAINIYYRHLGKADALEYLNSSLQAHVAGGKKDEIVVYGNTRHLSRMVAYYLNVTQGYNATKLLRFGFSEWHSDAPEMFLDCTSFDSLGKGTGPAGCTSNNFSTTIANITNVATLSGEGYANLDNIPGAVTSADLAEVARAAYDARFGNLSKPEYRISARELYDLLDDNQDGTLAGAGDNLTNDPFVLSNRGTTTSGGEPGPYDNLGHIPTTVAVDVSDGTDRQEAITLDNTDFLPTNRTIVHHCWVGVSQQYGGTWYNLLGYEARSLDWGVQGWTTDATVRNSADIVVTPLDYPYDTGDSQKPYVIPKSPSDGDSFTTNAITFSAFVLEGGKPNVTLWANWSGGWSVKNYTDTAENVTEYNFTVTVPDGHWGWYINVTDESDNQSNWTSNRTINVDATPPNVTINSPGSNTYISSLPVINATVTDVLASIGSVIAEINGSDNVTLEQDGSTDYYNASYAFSEGQNNVTIYASDSVGNMNDTEIIYFTVDVESPRNISAAEFKPIVSTNTSHYINITWVDDGSSVDTVWINYTNDTSTILYPNYSVGAEYTWIINETYDKGLIFITAYANDSNAHESNISFSYEVTSETRITLESPTNNSWWDIKNVTLSGTTTQDANITYSVNGGPIRTAANGSTSFSNYTGDVSEDYGNITQGKNNVTVYAVNKDNASDSDTVTHYFHVDTIDPNISYNSDTTPSGNLSQNWIFVNVSIIEANIDNTTIILEGISGNDTYWNVTGGTNYWWNKSPGYGDYTIKVYVTDLAGNTNVTDERTITLDTAAPVITIDSPASTVSAGSEGSVDLKYSIVEDNLDWTGYSLNGKANITLSGNTTLFYLIDGQHNVTIYANDTAGNANSTTKWFNVSSSSVDDRYENDSIDLPANESVRIGILNNNWTLRIVTNVSLTGAINITFMTSRPSEATSAMTDLALSKYLKIDASDNIKGNMSYAMVELNYTDAEVSAASISEGTLRPYKWNGSEWIRVVEGLSWVNDAGVNTTGKFVWANVTNFSVYGVGGDLYVPPTPPRESGGGGPPPPKTTFARAILTTSEDWRYAMMAAGFAAANDYILIATPTHSIDLPTRNNIKWFDELIIIGDSFVISDGIEDEFVKLRRTMVPGFAKLNTTRVKGVNFFGTAVQLVKRWKDPKGIIVVRGDVFADALVASQLSAATDSPILFTMPREIWPSALNTIKRLKLDVTIVGGEKAVSKKVEDAIKATGVNVKRVGGKDRYETAALVGDEYIKAAKEKGKDIDTITFLSGKKGEWANTLGFRSYVYNSTILYIKEVEGEAAVPTPTKNFIAAHPYISSASIMVKDGAKPKGYDDVDAYIRNMQFEVDPTVYTFIMDIDPDKKDYTLDTNTKSLSTTVSQIVIDALRIIGVVYNPPGGGSDGGGSDGGGNGGS